MTERIETIGALEDGTGVEQVTLTGGGLTASFLTYGSVLQTLYLDGHAYSLVLGLSSLQHYLADAQYFGATVGRCANRIANGRFMLDGVCHQLDRNFLGKHHLHGGASGAGNRLWRIQAASENSLTVAIDMPDGEMGYPGNLSFRQTFTLLANGVLDIAMSAQGDAPTLCNFAHHSYFNLDGSPTITDHELRVAADHYLAVDEELIPSDVMPVEASAFDFRQAKRVGEVSRASVLDHNFCLSRDREAMRPVAWLYSPKSGVEMAIATTEPGLQVYDGAGLDCPVLGVDGRKIVPHGGIALEPQVWPDAINHADWFQPILRPGETYEQQTQFRFSKG